uniref:C2H2-type domain-containing protein n=1 Tax=Sinocyclocheilus anshuiensis TaxID=1608454 RepID=A0A671QDY3_9TELE
MKSTEVDPGLFTDSYCKVCSAQLISESQRVAHYEVSNTHTHTHTHVHIKHKHILIPVNLICCQ